MMQMTQVLRVLQIFTNINNLCRCPLVGLSQTFGTLQTHPKERSLLLMQIELANDLVIFMEVTRFSAKVTQNRNTVKVNFGGCKAYHHAVETDGLRVASRGRC